MREAGAGSAPASLFMLRALKSFVENRRKAAIWAVFQGGWP